VLAYHQVDRGRGAGQELTSSPLLPLLETLQHFPSLAILDRRIRDVYAFLDCDGSGSLSKVVG